MEEPSAGGWFVGGEILSGLCAQRIATTGGPARFSHRRQWIGSGLFRIVRDALRGDEEREVAARGEGIASLSVPAGWSHTIMIFRHDRFSASWRHIHAVLCGQASLINMQLRPSVPWSGESLLKYFGQRAMPMRWICSETFARGLPRVYFFHRSSIANLAPGVCERVNLSDWEGKGKYWGNIFGSCSWWRLPRCLPSRSFRASTSRKMPPSWRLSTTWTKSLEQQRQPHARSR